MSEPKEYTDNEGRVFRYERGQRVYLDGGKDTGADVVIAKPQPDEKAKAAAPKKRKPAKPAVTETGAPVFKSSRTFCDDIALRCLKAKIKNSNLPGVARRHIAEKGEDPACHIFLRGEDAAQISSWQQEMLTRLLEKGELVSGIEQAMKEYASGKVWAGYDETSELFADIRTHGIVPHITVHTMVIDEILNRVLLNCGTEWDLNLMEHGITISFFDGMWKFGYADEFAEYQSEVDDLERTKQWAKIYPEVSASSEAQPDADASFLYGTWEFDELAAREMLQKLGCTRSKIEESVSGFAPYRFIISRSEIRMKSSSYRFDFAESDRALKQMMSQMGGLLKGLQSLVKLPTPEELQKKNPGMAFDEAGYQYYVCKFLGCDRRGDQVTLRFRPAKSGIIESRDFFYRDARLMDLEGLVMKRVAD